MGKVYCILRRDKKFKDAYQIKISHGGDLYLVLTYILPYLWIKHEQCRIVLDFMVWRKEIKPITGRGHRGATSFNNVDKDLYERLLVLNKKGQ